MAIAPDFAAATGQWQYLDHDFIEPLARAHAHIADVDPTAHAHAVNMHIRLHHRVCGHDERADCGALAAGDHLQPRLLRCCAQALFPRHENIVVDDARQLACRGTQQASSLQRMLRGQQQLHQCLHMGWERTRHPRLCQRISARVGMRALQLHKQGSKLLAVRLGVGVAHSCGRVGRSPPPEQPRRQAARLGGFLHRRHERQRTDHVHQQARQP